ncbi:MAG: PAS domain-containing protein [Kiloniellaceae bacterium]
MVNLVHDPAPDSIDHPGLRALYAYWEGCRAGRLLPGRRDLDPLDIPQLLPNIMLIDVASEVDMRYRLVGTALVGRMGRDITGLRVQDCYPGRNWEKILADYLYAIRKRRPCLRRDVAGGPSSQSLADLRLLLPLAGDGERVDMLLAGAYWQN